MQLSWITRTMYMSNLHMLCVVCLVCISKPKSRGCYIIFLSLEAVACTLCVYLFLSLGLPEAAHFSLKTTVLRWGTFVLYSIALGVSWFEYFMYILHEVCIQTKAIQHNTMQLTQDSHFQRKMSCLRWDLNPRCSACVLGRYQHKSGYPSWHLTLKVSSSLSSSPGHDSSSAVRGETLGTEDTTPLWEGLRKTSQSLIVKLKLEATKYNLSIVYIPIIPPWTGHHLLFGYVAFNQDTLLITFRTTH